MSAKTDAFQAEYNIHMTAEFVPFSKSRNKDDTMPSLNYVVTIYKDDHPFLVTNYMMGTAYCPAAQRFKHGTISHAESVQWECEHGRKFGGSDKRIMPELAHVLYSLACDAEALRFGSFEEWAEELGYSSDSRKAEAVYQACLAIGLKLRSRLGERGLASLIEAVSDE